MTTKIIKTARPVAALRAGRNDWYRMVTAGPGPKAVAEVHIYDEIGYWGVTASDFARDLRDMDVSAIDVHINTPGGDVFDGIAIYNALRQHRAEITVYVDSLAASIGSVIAMAGDRIIMAKYSSMMIHEASGVAMGANSEEMRKMADLLDKTSDTIAKVYADRSGTDIVEWRNRMRAETWFNAEEAVEFGLADEVSTNNTSVSNSWDLSLFNYPSRAAAPAPLAGPTDAPENVLMDAPTIVPVPPPTRPAAALPETPALPPVEVKVPTGEGGGEPEIDFTALFDPEAMRAALSFAADPPVPEHEAPFEFDADIFRAVMRDRANNAPAIAQHVQPAEEPTFESAYDAEAFAAMIREMVA